MKSLARFASVWVAISSAIATAAEPAAAQPATTKPAAPVASSAAPSAEVAALVAKVVEAAGGKEKLLTLFSMKENLIVNPDGVKKPTPRSSVLEPPKNWWIGPKDRGTEPAKYLVWVWSLGALTDPTSKLTPVAEITDGEATLVGLEISGSIEPPMKVYFDKQKNRLARIDWRGSLHRFSEWKELDGLHYPSRTVGSYVNGKMWYETDITEIVRLKELPSGLTR